MILIAVAGLVSIAVALIVGWNARLDNGWILAVKMRYMGIGVLLGAAAAYEPGRNLGWLIAALVIGYLLFRSITISICKNLQKDYRRERQNAR